MCYDEIYKDYMTDSSDDGSSNYPAEFYHTCKSPYTAIKLKDPENYCTEDCVDSNRFKKSLKVVLRYTRIFKIKSKEEC